MRSLDLKPTGYRFSVFEVNLHVGEIRKSGLRVKLPEQPFQVMVFLLRHAPNLVTRDDLRRHLWDENTFVEFDHGLRNAISRIREVLGDSPETPRFIETIPKRGYRFIAPVEVIEVPAAIPGNSHEGHANSHGNGGPPIVAGPGVPQAPPPTSQPDALSNFLPATDPVVADLSPPTVRVKKLFRMGIVSLLVAVAGVGLLIAFRSQSHTPATLLNYTQVTNFNDAVFAPAISPDGRLLAFLRGSDVAFPETGEVYTKVLPDGEPVPLTHDGWPKYGLTFSPDSSQVAYTSAEARGWNTRLVSVLGGDPRLLLMNAAGLTWLDEHHVLFSRIRTGLHMGVVTAKDNGAEAREIYWPVHERGMAHFSYISPDQKWFLVVEMGPTGAWERCRLVPFSGGSGGSQVGPAGSCTSAAWSPDQRWMYFSARVNGASHLWRQRFPDGNAEQITSGPTEEYDLAMAPDGRSVFSSVGTEENGVWLRDRLGDRLLSAEGYGALTSFSRDGRRVYYVLRRESRESPQELWVTDVATGKNEPLIQGFSITSYDISADEKLAVFAARANDGSSQIWLASCEHAFAPRMLTSSGEDSPLFDRGNDVIFRAAENGSNYLFRIARDGTEREKVTPGPILNIEGKSPDGRLALAMMPVDGFPSTAVFAIPMKGEGPLTRICPALCMAKWSPDGSRFYVDPILQGQSDGMTVEMPVEKGQSLPRLPPSGVQSATDAARLPGSKVLDISGMDPSRVGSNVAPGVADDTFAYAKRVVHSNIFRIPLP